MAGSPEVHSSRGVKGASWSCREASLGVEIWTGGQDTSPAGWVDQAGADDKRSLFIEGAFCGVEECHIRALPLGPASQFS